MFKTITKTKNTLITKSLLNWAIAIILLSINTISIQSQNLSGKVTDRNNLPIYGSTIYIKETNQGLTCNENGEYQTNLKAGKYTVEYRCLGYENTELQIDIKDKPIVRNIILEEKAFELAQITVSNKEDPAYAIIRRAIEKAPYHLNKVKSYNAESYIKANMGLTKVSSLINKIIPSDEGLKISDFKDKTFLQESFSEIIFTAPDNYKQTVKAFSSTIPNNLDPKDAASIIQSSLYSPKMGRRISPLNPSAFKYYKFKYEGFYEEDSYTINKIKIIPKFKDPELMSGYIYIAENTWDIRLAELTMSDFGGNMTALISYSEVSPKIFLPTSYNNKSDISIMGIEGFVNYYSSIKYIEVVTNDSIINSTPKRKEKKSLDISRNRLVDVKADTLATKRDSAYWSQIRNIPLSEKDIKSYSLKDSIQNHLDSVHKKYHNSKFSPDDLITGGRIGGDSTKVALEYGGLVGVLRDYNFVDGFQLGQKITVGTHWNNHRNSLKVSPEVAYTTARKDFVWNTQITFDYSPMRKGNLNLSFGDISTDFNPIGANRLDNAISSLIAGKNVSMLYRKKYLNLVNKIDLSNGLQLNTGVEIAKRSGLENNTKYSFFGGKSQIKPNLVTTDHSDLLSYSIGLRYAPQYYYSIHNGVKYYQYNHYPTFSLNYKEGFSSLMDDNSRFRKLEANISQSISTDLFSSFNYNINTGIFLGNRENMNFADYHHFNTSDLFLITKTPYESFLLLNNYEASTNKYWVSTHLNYYSKYILLKRLPFLQGKLFNESLHFKYLYSPNKKNYSEVGYSVDLIKSISIGAYCAFDKFEYDKFGLRLSFSTSIFD